MERLLLFSSLFCLLFVSAYSNLMLFSGDRCRLENGKTGICSEIHECTYAEDLLEQGKRPINCGFIEHDPIVCCPRNFNRARETRGERSRQECEKIYRSDDQGIPRVPAYGVAGGEKTEEGEYPHMVRLGIGHKRSSIEWYCGGSLISETFVLTAAHCIYSQYGTINWARLGEVTNFSTYEYIEVIRSIVHPEYSAALHYNDIALCELAGKPQFSFLVGPACLHHEPHIPTGFGVTVTGWGATEFGGEAAKDLLKANVSLFTHQECRSKYPATIRKLSKGIMDEIQLCAGGRNAVKDTCQGDSGGPIQIPHIPLSIYKTISRIVGVTSFGKVCGFENQPGVYVRIYPYLPWIEKIVWRT